MRISKLLIPLLLLGGLFFVPQRAMAADNHENPWNQHVGRYFGILSKNKMKDSAELHQKAEELQNKVNKDLHKSHESVIDWKKKRSKADHHKWHPEEMKREMQFHVPQVKDTHRNERNDFRLAPKVIPVHMNKAVKRKPAHLSIHRPLIVAYQPLENQDKTKEIRVLKKRTVPKIIRISTAARRLIKEHKKLSPKQPVIPEPQKPLKPEGNIEVSAVSGQSSSAAHASGSGTGASFFIKGYISGIMPLESKEYFSLLYSKIHLFSSQWVNAPPNKPPQKALSFLNLDN